MMELRGTQLKQGMECMFNTPISSMMSISPLFFWDIIVNEINRYATQKIKKQLEEVIQRDQGYYVATNGKKLLVKKL